MAKVTQFIKESYQEMVHRVTWPTFGELQSSAVLVLIASLIFALVVYLMDKASYFTLKAYFDSFFANTNS